MMMVWCLRPFNNISARERWDDDGLVFCILSTIFLSWRNEMMTALRLTSCQHFSHGEMRWWWFGVLHPFNNISVIEKLLKGCKTPNHHHLISPTNHHHLISVIEKWNHDGLVFNVISTFQSWRNEMMRVWCFTSLQQYLSHGEMRWGFGV